MSQGKVTPVNAKIEVIVEFPASTSQRKVMRSLVIIEELLNSGSTINQIIEKLTLCLFKTLLIRL